MKKNILFLVSSIFIANVLSAESDVLKGATHLSGVDKGPLKIMGSAELKKMKVESLDVMGPLEFEDLQVSGMSDIKGPVKGKKGQFTTVEKHGPFKVEGFVADLFKGTGPTSLKKAEVKGQFNVTGPLKFKDLKVGGATVIIGPAKGKKGQFIDIEKNGPFKAEEFVANHFKGTGPTSFEKAQIKGDIDLVGPFISEDSNFQKMILTIGNNDESKNIAGKCELKDSTSKDIYIRKNMPDETQLLVLAGKTIVDGNIEFESGKGIVEADKDVVIKGEIKGVLLKRQ